MNLVKKWYEEAKAFTKVHNTYDSSFIIYKGFKISLREGVYTLFDVRFSNLYSEVTPDCIEYFKKYGFVAGVDLVGLERDRLRIVNYKKKAEGLYAKRAKFKKELNQNKKLNEKRIRNINLKIDESIDLMFFYQVRVNQLNIKYKQNE